jgi:hypothetical protein
MRDLLKQFLSTDKTDSPDELLWRLRELMQSLTLLGLWRARFFEHAAFYGGTALRILYGLDRFSEDLDFSTLSPQTDWDWTPYGRAVEKELNAFGFSMRFESHEKRLSPTIESAYLKGNTRQQLLVFEPEETLLRHIHGRSLIKIKLELDKDPPPGFSTDMKYHFLPVPFAIRSYSLPCLFAGKMHAMLFREWKNRVKGRDWYDFIWFVSQNIPLDLKHLESRMRYSGHFNENISLTREIFLNILKQKIDNLNLNTARKDVIPFLKNPEKIDIWSKDFFLSAVEKISFTT